MDEGLLREIAGEYLAPLFSGAKLDDSSEPSSSRDNVVASTSPVKINFKTRREDIYRLTLSRSQPFSSDSIVPEIYVVRAFIDVVSSMAQELETDLKNDLLSTFQRKVVARSIGIEQNEKIILEGIDHLMAWGNRLYEGFPISASIGFRNRPQGNDKVLLSELADKEFGAVVSNGFDTLMEFDFSGRFVAHMQLEFSSSEFPKFCPVRQAPTANWTDSDDRRVALTLNRLGEILLFRDGQLMFAWRSGRWHFLNHAPVLKQMNVPRVPQIREALYETCLDASFARTGACLGVVAFSNRGNWKHLVDENDQLEILRSTKAKTLSQIVKGDKFQDIDRRLRQELVAIDGATIISHEGDILAVGAILRIPGGSSGGGRLAAAKALSRLGLGIKVSQDGGITGFRPDKEEEAFKVM